MTPREIATAINQLTAEQLVELKTLLDWDGPGGEAVGVREPRRPSPEDEGWPEPAPLPPDYWETAE